MLAPPNVCYFRARPSRPPSLSAPCLASTPAEASLFELCASASGPSFEPHDRSPLSYAVTYLLPLFVTWGGAVVHVVCPAAVSSSLLVRVFVVSCFLRPASLFASGWAIAGCSAFRYGGAEVHHRRIEPNINTQGLGHIFMKALIKCDLVVLIDVQGLPKSLWQTQSLLPVSASVS